MSYTKNQILELAKKEDVKFIRLQFTDVLGQLKNVAITFTQLAKALDNECMFDGSSIEGFVRIEESDMYLYPDYNTFLIFPWRPQEGKVARLICDVYTSEKKPFIGDPRGVLKRVLAKAKDMGYTVNVGPEMEFFLYNLDEKGAPTLESNDQGGYFDMAPVDLGSDCRRDIAMNIEQMGFEVEASHHEVAHAQHEIDFKYSEALDGADKIVTFKHAAKSIATRHGLFASFLPKPKYGINGSGMHVNMSLCKNGVNVFYDPNTKDQLSEICHQFIAGGIKYVRDVVMLTNPLVNSYRRLVPGYEAPVYVAWSGRNRSPLIRVPASRGAGTRIEFRNPDPACNPYLALAALISTGLKGIEEGLTPPASTDTNIFSLTADEREALGIMSLPASLSEALDIFKKSTFVKEFLGDHICSKLIEAKTMECQEYRANVTSWEIKKYLRIT